MHAPHGYFGTDPFLLKFREVRSVNFRNATGGGFYPTFSSRRKSICSGTGARRSPTKASRRASSIRATSALLSRAGRAAGSIMPNSSRSGGRGPGRPRRPATSRRRATAPRPFRDTATRKGPARTRRPTGTQTVGSDALGPHRVELGKDVADIALRHGGDDSTATIDLPRVLLKWPSTRPVPRSSQPSAETC